ncbi:anti-sigma regulatory factor (Ser/Thr protein kinase) [Streptomyces sp. 1114.5]|uniref:ATP-binding protein n=1 Tax=Streptomyces sp. 1114.5 TaxID=1938830 RepID=UPI000EAF182E|nr:ATP-binding protein [Streptomyces sp. 1114.5]RKT18596.1 anti-sigma regulatory factor (Ser/Thr protein kinase) [Streptomyces sp. 1114.5]
MDGQSRFPRQRTSSGDAYRSGPAQGPVGAAGTTGPAGTAGTSATAGPSSPAGTGGTSGTAGATDTALPGAPAPGCALHRRLHLALDPADLVAVGAVRRRLRSALSHWGVPELSDTAELLSSELVTNALVHTGKGAVFDAVLGSDHRLRIEVHDGTSRLPGCRRDPEAEYATSGRGLLLVEALADAWGVQLRGDGKVTWFELTLP